MSEKCVIPGCNSTELTKTLFHFPKDDFSLLKKWSQEIPFVNFLKIDLQNNLICEDHFKEENFATGSNTKVLASNTVPSVFNYAAIVSSNSCRFCLGNYCGSAERVDINEEVRKNYEDLLDIKWLDHEDLPKFTCRSCAERLEASINFKNQIKKVHNVLEKLLKEKSLSEIKQEIEEINFLSDLATECPCEVNIKSENSLSSSNGSEEFSEIDNEKNKQHTLSKVILEDATNYSYRFLKGKKKFFCGMCTEVFNSKSDLTAHMQFSHLNGAKIINCGVCAKKFSSRTNLVKHMKENHLDSDVEDPEPNRKSFKRYNNHFKCKLCQKSNFASLESLRRHHQVFHSNDENKKKRILDREKNRQQYLSQKTNCTICGKSVSKRYIRAHQQRYHEDNSRKLVCDFCGKRQFNKQEMTFHMETNHMERQLLKCPQCDFKCHLKNYMKEHINNVHLNKGLVCELCGQSVANKYKLVNHLRVWHTGEKPYKCKIPGCDKTFANSARRGEHIKSVHLIQPSICTTCGKDFPTQVSLNRHYHTVHSEKKIVCTYEGCKLKFATNSKMLIHLASHTGIKKWNCKYCPHTNVTKSGLKRHLRDVHMNIVINCELCDFTTGRKETYRKHVKAKHIDIGEDRFKQLLIKIRDIPLPKTELDE